MKDDYNADMKLTMKRKRNIDLNTVVVKPTGLIRRQVIKHRACIDREDDSNSSSRVSFDACRDVHCNMVLAAAPCSRLSPRLGSGSSSTNERTRQQNEEHSHFSVIKRQRMRLHSTTRTTTYYIRQQAFHCPTNLVGCILMCVLFLKDFNNNNRLFFVSAQSPFRSCFLHLATADSDGDNLLTQTEYANAIQTISGGNIAEPGSVSSIAAVFSSQVASGGSGVNVEGVRDADAESTNVGAMQEFCTDIYTAILTETGASSTTVSDTRCLVAMSIADTDKDDAIAQDEEYPRYANQISGNLYGIGIAFSDLPQPVQAIFADFADPTTSTIDVTGSKQGSSPTAEQEASLFRLCRHTAIAVLEADGDPLLDPATDSTASSSNTTTNDSDESNLTDAPADTAIDATDAPADANDSNTTSSGEPLFSFEECARFMAISDRSRDNLLNSDEYVSLIGKLSGDQVSAPDYDSLPDNIKELFDRLATTTDTQIDIAGTKPSETPTAEQKTTLTALCNSMDSAIQTALQTAGGGVDEADTSDSSGGGDGTASPGDGVVIISTDKCKKDMIVADLSRDNMLDSSEYVRFISRNAPDDVGMTDDFESLTEMLQANFYALAGSEGDDAAIDITGAKPSSDITDEQNAAIEKICVASSYAIHGPIETVAPTELTEANVTIYNSFIVSNTMRLKAKDFEKSSEYRNYLEKAYNDFASTIMVNYTAYIGYIGSVYGETSSTEQNTSDASIANTTTRRFLRYEKEPELLHEPDHFTVQAFGHRKLSVAVLLTVTGIEQMVDTECPDFVTGSNRYCLIAFASFVVTVKNEKDLKSFEQKMTNITQNAINANGDGENDNIENLLQLQLLQQNDKVRLRIEGASDPVRPETEEQNEGAISNMIGMDTGGSHAGAVIGSLLVVIAVFGGTYYWWRSYGSKNPPAFVDKIMDKLERYGINIKRRKPAKSPVGTNKTMSYGDDNSDLHGNAYEGGRGRTPAATDDDDGSANFSVNEHGQDEDDHDKAGGKVEKEGGGGVFGKFNAGKKKNASGKDELGHFGEGFESQDDFICYAFDDPAELKQNISKSSDLGSNLDHFPGAETVWKADNPWDASSKWGADGEASKSGFSFDNLSIPGSEEYDDDDDSEAASKKLVDNTTEGEAATNVNQLEALVDNGIWDGVAAKFGENKLNDEYDSDPSEHSKSDDGSQSSDEVPQAGVKNNDSLNQDTFDENTHQGSSLNVSSEEIKLRNDYRNQVTELVRKTCPDEIDNIGSMLDQFAGREPELIKTLQAMYERSATQRALKAVHKSKKIPERENRTFATGGAEGAAVIAAASMLNSDTHTETEYDDEGSDSGSYSDSDSYSGSYSQSNSRSTRSRRTSRHSESDSGSGSGSGSYDDETGDHSDSRRSDDDDEGSSGSKSRSEGSYDDDRSYSGSYDDETGSHSGSRSRTENDDDHSYSGSYDDETGSHTDGSESEPTSKRKYRAKDEDMASYLSGASGTQSYVSEASGSQSYTTGASRSYNSEDDDGSHTYASKSYNNNNDSYNSESYKDGSYSGSGSS